MKINKGIVKNINKKLIASLLAVSLATTLSGCDERANVGFYNWLEYKKDDSGMMVCKDVMLYDSIRHTKIVTFGVAGKQSTYLAYFASYNNGRHNQSDVYYNVFGGQVLYKKQDKETELTILEEENLADYLVSCDMVQNTYTEQELKDILNQIKEDYEQEKDKQLVIGN